MPHRHKHSQDKSEIEDKHVEEEKSSSPDPGILTDKKLCSHFLYALWTSLQAPLGQLRLFQFQLNKVLLNLFPYPIEGVQA